jgi:hypothetical protein
VRRMMCRGECNSTSVTINPRHTLTYVRRTNSHYETFVGETRTAARSRRTEDLVQENENLRLENDELRRRLGFDVTR